MSLPPVAPTLMLAGGTSGSPSGLNNPGQLEVTYQNLLSGAADMVNGLGTKTLIMSAGAIGTAGAIQIGNTETASEVAANALVLGDIAAFCRANGITVEVDAVLTNPATYGSGPGAINALVDQWGSVAAQVGLPVTAVQDIQEIGITQAPSSFAGYAATEAIAVRTLVNEYRSSSYRMTAESLHVGDMEGGGASSTGAISQWWAAYNAAAADAGLNALSYFTADPSMFSPWLGELSTASWQAFLEAGSTLAAAWHMDFDVVVQGSQTEASAAQFVGQAVQNAADLAKLAATGSIVVKDIMIQSWNAYPVGVGMISSPTSPTNEAAEIGATYQLYSSGSLTADGLLSSSAPGQAVVSVGTATALAPLAIQWDAADVSAGHRLGVVIIDQTGILGAAQHGSGTVSRQAGNILVLNGNSIDLAAELASVTLTEPCAGPDTIDIQSYGANGRLSDNQISIFAAAPGQSVSAITSASGQQGWLSASAILNAGTVAANGSRLTSETLYWSATGTAASPSAPGASAFVKIDAVHEPLAEYGVRLVPGATAGTATARVLDYFDPLVDDGAFPCNGYANNPGVNNIGFSPLPSWLPGSFSPMSQLTPFVALSTTNLFDPASGLLNTSTDALAPNPQTVVDPTGTHANAFAVAFNNGGTQATQYNTGSNASWSPGWGSQFSSATLTYDGLGRLAELFLQGGPASPLFSIDDVFSPNTGQLWEEMQATAPQPKAPGSGNYAGTDNAYRPGFATGPMYVTQFNTGDNPNWNGVDWGNAIASDTEVWADYLIIANFGAPAVSLRGQGLGGMTAFPYQFVNGPTLDLLYLPGSISVDLNNLASITLNSETMPSSLASLTGVNAAGATGTVALTGLAAGGSALTGGDNVSVITGFGNDIIVAGAGLTTIATGRGRSAISTSSHSATLGVAGDNNALSLLSGDVAQISGQNETVNGSGLTVHLAGGASATVRGSNNMIYLDGAGVSLIASPGSAVSVRATPANFVANLAALEALAGAGALSSISLVSGGTPNLGLSAAQVAADAAALACIRTPFVAAAPTAAVAAPSAPTSLSAAPAQPIIVDPPLGRAPAAPAPGVVAVLDTTTNLPLSTNAVAYNGPVQGIDNQCFQVTSNSVNITASTSSWFLHSGSGEDALSVTSGTNVLDGGSGSNFLVGGSGTDTFFADARGAPGDIWDTIVNFHAGDSVTLWGVTPADFRLSFTDNQGAVGYTGLTLTATAPGRSPVLVTFAGLTTASLGNGGLSETSGTESVSGSTYTSFHANI